MSLTENYKMISSSRNDCLVHYSDSFLNFLDSALTESSVEQISVIENGEKQAFFNFAIHKGDYGVVLNSLPFFGSHGGPVSSNKYYKDKLFEKIKLRLNEINPSSYTIIESPFNPLCDADIHELGVDEVDYRIGQITPLPADMTNFHVKTRNSIRKGQKLNMSFERKNDNDSWEWMQSVHEASIISLNGIPKTRKIFDLLKATLKNSVELWIGSINKKPICGLVTISYKQTVEYFTPVVEVNFRDSQALSALIYEVMIIASNGGYKLWNWGGTWESQVGVYRFKSRWGAEDNNYRYFNSTNSQNIRSASQNELIKSYPFFYVRKF
jgi:hypothetical protein